MIGQSNKLLRDLLLYLLERKYNLNSTQHTAWEKKQKTNYEHRRKCLIIPFENKTYNKCMHMTHLVCLPVRTHACACILRVIDNWTACKFNKLLIFLDVHMQL